MASRDDVLSLMKEKLAANGVESTKKDCGLALDVALQSISEVAMAEGSIRTTIGTFRRKEQAARVARNPRTGEQVDVPAKTTLGFKPASAKAEVAAPAKKAVAKKAPVAAPKKAAPVAKKVVKK